VDLATRQRDSPVLQIYRQIAHVHDRLSAAHGPSGMA
jgi:hypothetical protein